MKNSTAIQLVGGFIVGVIVGAIIASCNPPSELNSALCVTMGVSFALHTWMVFNPIAYLFNYHLDEWGFYIHPGKFLLYFIYLFLFTLATMASGCGIAMPLFVFVLWVITGLALVAGFVLGLVWACMMEFLGLKTYNIPSHCNQLFDSSTSSKKSNETVSKPQRRIKQAYQKQANIVEIVDTENGRKFVNGSLVGFTQDIVSVKPTSATDKFVNEYNVNGDYVGAYNI